MLTRIMITVLAFCLMAAPAMADRYGGDRYGGKYKITLDPVRPSGAKQTITCSDPSCSFTVNLNGHAPIDVVTVAGGGGIALYFKQGGMLLPVDGLGAYFPAASFAGKKTVKSEFTVYAPDTLDGALYAPVYGVIPLNLAQKDIQRDTVPVKMKASIRQIRP